MLDVLRCDFIIARWLPNKRTHRMQLHGWALTANCAVLCMPINLQWHIHATSILSIACRIAYLAWWWWWLHRRVYSHRTVYYCLRASPSVCLYVCVWRRTETYLMYYVAWRNGTLYTSLSLICNCWRAHAVRCTQPMVPVFESPCRQLNSLWIFSIHSAFFGNVTTVAAVNGLSARARVPFSVTFILCFAFATKRFDACVTFCRSHIQFLIF